MNNIMQQKEFDYDYYQEIEKKALNKKVQLRKREIDRLCLKIRRERHDLEEILRFLKFGKSKKLEEMRKIIIRCQKQTFVLQKLIREYQLARREFIV